MASCALGRCVADIGAARLRPSMAHGENRGQYDTGPARRLAAIPDRARSYPSQAPWCTLARGSRGWRMEAVLYAARDGALALLPDCFKPCRELEEVHGRFRACGRICVDDVMHRPLWRRILADFDRCGYAV